MIELKTKYGDTLYAWVHHRHLDPPTLDRINGVKSEDILKWLRGQEMRKLLREDTSKAGHNADGLSPDKAFKLASHITLVRVYDCVDSYVDGLPPLSSAISVCSKKDQFSRKAGRTTALKRALGKARYRLVADREVDEQ